MAISTTHDITPDSPTNTFATWNALNKQVGDPVYSNGNLLAQDTVNNVMNAPVTCHFPRIEGFKWYAEFYYYEGFYDTGAAAAPMSFIVTSDEKDSSLGIYSTNVPEYFAGSKNSYAQYRTANNTMPSRSYPVTVNYGLVGILFDYNLNTIQFAINGNWCSEVFPMDSNAVISGINLSGKYNLSGSDSLYVRVFHGGSDIYKVAINCGQDHTFGGYPNSLASSSGYSDANGIGSFYYQPPTDALALCTANLPDPDIDPAVDDLPEDYFKAVKWSGANNSSGRSFPVGFQPDLVWAKRRSQAAAHLLYDSVRGAGANKELSSSGTGSEGSGNPSEYDYLSSFDPVNSSNNLTGGFSSTWSGANATDYFNNTSHTYVAWCWKAGGAPSGSTSTTGSAKRINTSGTQDDTSCDALASAASTAGASNVITPTLMSINQKAGFSIVKYVGNGNSGQTVPHGLSSTPELVIAKNLDDAANWLVYHKSLSSNIHYLHLELPNSETSNSAFWSAFSANTFTLGNSNHINGLSDDIIAYCWHSVAGYSAFGSYTGNGSTDGPFVYTGFRPAWLLVKNIDTESDWWIMDTTRDTYNVAEKVLYPNLANDEFVSVAVFGRDFLSNGFTVRNNNFVVNGNNETYIYAAFAEMPFKYATAR